MRIASIKEQISRTQEAADKNPVDDTLRVRLFLLHAQLGHWEHSLAQLRMAAQLNSGHAHFARTYTDALQAELWRQETFQGTRSPRMLGAERQWASYLLEALREDATQHHAMAADIREQALDAAPTVTGLLNGHMFQSIRDADTRLGPLLELIHGAEYCWLPLEMVWEICVEPPASLHDQLWQRAHIALVGGDVISALLPVRYPEPSDGRHDPPSAFRQIPWIHQHNPERIRHGVKVFRADTQEHSVLDVHHMRINPPSAPGHRFTSLRA